MKISRKLRQIIDSKIPEYYYKRYPKLVDFLHAFAEFADQEGLEDALNLSDNLDIEKIDEKFLDDYFQQYCSAFIDTDIFQITNSNKRLFLTISKFFYKNKGKKLSFDIALRYLTQFFTFDSENYVADVSYDLIEDKNNWYSGTHVHPPYQTVPYQLPYRYIIETDISKSFIATLIDTLNPVGFTPRYEYEQYETETYSIATNVSNSLTTVQGDKEPLKYDGTHKYSGTYLLHGVSFPLLYNGYYFKSGTLDVLTD